LRRIVRAVELAEAFVRRKHRIGRGAEIHPHASKQLAMRGDMPRLYRVVRLRVQPGERGRHPRGGIAADVLVAHEVRRRRDVKGHLVRVSNRQRVVVYMERATAGDRFQLRLVAELPLDAKIVSRFAAHDERIVPVTVHLEVVGRIVRVRRVSRAAQLRIEGDLVRAIRREPDNDDLIHR
jgi:hypothetical protein